jgi:hypothetical protein
MDLTKATNAELRAAVRSNRVSFPSQPPVFARLARPDIHWRVAVLFFVHGWSLTAVAKRYGISRERTGQIAHAWGLRSIRTGYIQEIPMDEVARAGV